MNNNYNEHLLSSKVEDSKCSYSSDKDFQIDYKDPVVKLINQIVFFLQRYLTITGYIRECYKKKKKNFQLFVSKYVLFWLILVVFLINIIKFNEFVYFIVFLFCYRVWEIVIINFWLFVFKQNATTINDHKPKENDVRIVLLLFIQYLTIILAFAGIYSIINSISVNSFDGSPTSIISFVYFSVVTITTLGYGDIIPSGNSLVCQSIVIIEVLIGMLFILLFLSTILKNINLKYVNKL